MPRQGHDAAKAATWEEVLGELRLLRGRNRWRGTFVQLRAQGLLRIDFEARDGRLRHQAWQVHITDDVSTLWAVRLPDGLRSSAGDAGDWRAWLRTLVDDSRGKPYLETDSSKAHYRRPTDKA